MKLKIKNDYSKILVCGLQGSGKTYFVKHLLNSKLWKKPIVYVVNKDDGYQDITGIYTYTPKAPITEFKTFIKFVYNLIQERKIDCLVIDEADLFFSNNFEINSFDEFNDIILNHRHFKLNIVLITRRPQDLPTKIVESCKHIYIFSLEGANALKKFEDIQKNLSLEIRKLDYNKHNFVYKEIAKTGYVCQPIKSED
jgi:DNA helicase HerA-like ATPase